MKKLLIRIFFKKRVEVFIIVLSVLLFPAFLSAEMLHPDKPDAAKKCALCHFQWVYTFFNEHKDGDLIPMPKEKMVASEEMCFSCHDGSVVDSRDSAFHGPGHQAGVLPSKSVSIPEDFPLDYDGRMQCATCHTPHALSSKMEEGVEVRVFLRASNEDSNMCMLCHVDKSGGPKHGNHSINVSSRKKPLGILQHGGRFGESIPNQVICETCHVAHGGLKNKFLVLSPDDSSSSSLCVTCHGKNPGQSVRGIKQGSHPINVKPENSTIPVRWSDGKKVVVGKYGELICTTCHRPHNAVDKKTLLAEPNHKDSLCIECHQEKRFIAGSSHDLKTIAPEEKNIKGQRASSLGLCASCHLVHGGKGKIMWARKTAIKKNQGMFCLNCHSPGGIAEKVIPEDYSHPMDVSASSMKFRQSSMKIRCSTCHDFHNPFPLYKEGTRKGIKRGKFLRFSNQGPSGVCIDCHPRYALIEGTDHDLKITAPDYKNVYGQTTKQAGVCSPCHSAHKASHIKYLWSTSLGSAVQAGWGQNNSEGEDIMTMMCTGCHSPGGIAEKQIPQIGLHPKGFRIPDNELISHSSETTFENVNDEFPIYTSTGDTSSSGNIVCATCHNPHQWNPNIEEGGPGKNVEGNATNSFLRRNLQSKFCAECHGKDSLIKSIFFHSDKSRQKK